MMEFHPVSFQMLEKVVTHQKYFCSPSHRTGLSIRPSPIRILFSMPSLVDSMLDTREQTIIQLRKWGR